MDSTDGKKNITTFHVIDFNVGKEHQVKKIQKNKVSPTPNEKSSLERVIEKRLESNKAIYSETNAFILAHSSENLFFGKQPVSILNMSAQKLPKIISTKFPEKVDHFFFLSCESGVSTNTQKSYAHDFCLELLKMRAEKKYKQQNLSSIKTVGAPIPPYGIRHNVVTVDYNSGKLSYVCYRNSRALQLNSEITKLDGKIFNLKAINLEDNSFEIKKLEYQLAQKKAYVANHPEYWPIKYADERLLKAPCFTYKIENGQVIEPVPIDINRAQLISWAYEIEKELLKVAKGQGILEDPRLINFFHDFRYQLAYADQRIPLSDEDISAIIHQLLPTMQKGFYKTLITSDSMKVEIPDTIKNSHIRNNGLVKDNLSQSLAHLIVMNDMKKHASKHCGVGFSRLFDQTTLESNNLDAPLNQHKNIEQLHYKLRQYLVLRQQRNYLTILIVYLLAPVLNVKQLLYLLDHLKTEEHKYRNKESSVEKLTVLLINLKHDKDYKPLENECFSQEEVSALMEGTLKEILINESSGIPSIYSSSNDHDKTIEYFLNKYSQKNFKQSEHSTLSN